MEIFMSTLHLAVPTTYLWLVIFYSTFHAYLNFWGELTRFSDRRFYLDWWNAENLSVFWRKWNFPIHSFLFRHVYYPMRRRNVSAQNCLLWSFFISAVLHEYLMIGVVGTINGMAFWGMMANVPAIMI